MSPSINTSTTVTSPITSRQPHSGSTPPTSPIENANLALLRKDDDSPSASPPRSYPLSIPPVLTLEPPTPLSATLAAGWTFNWGSARKDKEKGHKRSISREEINDDSGDLRKKKRSLSDRLGEASGDLAGVMKRRMSGVSGVRRDEEISKDRAGRWGEVKRMIGVRVRYATRREHLPFLIVFVVCLVMFLSALAGVGSVLPADADAVAMDSAAAFTMGQPVYEGVDAVNGQQIMAARRKMEEAWEKKKRPKDGAWMKKQRNDGAVRRKAKSYEKGKAGEKAIERPPPIDKSIREEAQAVAAP